MDKAVVMDGAVALNALSARDHQKALAIISWLNECQTREELNQVLKTALTPLMNCNGVFYTQSVCEKSPPQLLDSMNQTVLSEHGWVNFLYKMLQEPILTNLVYDNINTSLATNTFSYHEQNDQQPTLVKSIHQIKYCTVIALFDTPPQSTMLCFCRLHSQEQHYSQRDIELFKLLRPALLQTIKVILFQEECRNLKQMTDHLYKDSDPLAVIRNDGIIMYKNHAFTRAIEQEDEAFLSKLFSQVNIIKLEKITLHCFLSKLGKHQYAVTLMLINETTHDNTSLYLLQFSRIANKNGQRFCQLGRAGLTNRELEITTLICQGIPTRNISEQINLSYHTVRNHIKSIYYKMGVSTRSEMLVWIGET